MGNDFQESRYPGSESPTCLPEPRYLKLMMVTKLNLAQPD